MIAAIPSPSFNSIGPFTLYGLCIALGVVAAVQLGQRRRERMDGDPEHIAALAIWGVPAGVVGARLYHVITDWHRFSGEPITEIFNIRAGGLGVPGGMFLGVLTGLLVAKRRGLSIRPALDAIVPGLPLAQAIGRWGNWFNQEVYGGPTNLPWGLSIDEAHRVEEFKDVETFHPTFLYESLWNLALTAVLLWADSRRLLKRGRLIAIYLIGYGIGRLWIETVRIDAASELFGLRVNIWMSLALIVGGLVIIAWPGRNDRTDESTEDPVSATA